MIKVYERLFVGTEFDCRTGDYFWAVVHACKSPCHQSAVGYRGNLPSTHPHYLVLEITIDLYLNIIDPPGPLFKPELFISFMRFAAKHWDDGHNLLIHCNQGESRAPSLAMLFMAKHIHAIDSSGFDTAKAHFIRIFPGYAPGAGIQLYLRQHWTEF